MSLPDHGFAFSGEYVAKLKAEHEAKVGKLEQELQHLKTRADTQDEYLQKLQEGLASACSQLSDAQDDLKRLDGACWYCINPDIEDPWRHEHEPNGGHWHHRIDPGDGLPSDCNNSAMLERVFQEQQTELASEKERADRLEKAIQSRHDYGPASPGEQEAAWHAYCARAGWDPNAHPSAKNTYVEGFCDGDSFSEGDEGRAILRDASARYEKHIAELKESYLQKMTKVSELEAQLQQRFETLTRAQLEGTRFVERNRELEAQLQLKTCPHQCDSCKEFERHL